MIDVPTRPIPTNSHIAIFMIFLLSLTLPLARFSEIIIETAVGRPTFDTV